MPTQALTQIIRKKKLKYEHRLKENLKRLKTPILDRNSEL